MTRGYRLLIKWARTVHIYATLSGLLLILFFALTGFMLNHDTWFSLNEPVVRAASASVPAGLLGGPDKLAIVEHLRGHCGAGGLMNAFDVEEGFLKVVFKSPGRHTEATINRHTGVTELVYESRGLLGRLTDLHRGKESGPAWSLVIDCTCVLLFLVATTGLILWYSLRTRFHRGLAALTLGLVFFAALYIVAIP